MGEASVVVLVHSKHRKEAFKGCKYIIDQIKKKVTIWKS
ncbi:MAG: molybdenum cofactor biosynthesis protein MoaE [bacterium]